MYSTMNVLLLLLLLTGVLTGGADASRLLTNPFGRILADLHAKAAPPPKQNFCDHTRLKAAQNGFNRDIGIQENLDWRNAEHFGQELRSVLVKGVDGLLRLCAARTMFYQSLAKTYSMCINRYHFIEEGLSKENADAYVQIFKMLEFLCNGGFLQSVQKFDCVLKADASTEARITKCIEDFSDTVGTQGYEKLCDASETLLTCVRQPYYENCGMDAGWWNCEQYRLYLEIDQFCPHLTCSYAIEPVKQPKHKSSRNHLFHSENPFFMSSAKQSLFASLGAKAEQRMKRRKREANAQN